MSLAIGRKHAHQIDEVKRSWFQQLFLDPNRHASESRFPSTMNGDTCVIDSGRLPSATGGAACELDNVLADILSNSAERHGMQRSRTELGLSALFTALTDRYKQDLNLTKDLTRKALVMYQGQLLLKGMTTTRRMCDFCGREENLRRCSSCKYTSYCSRTCQALAWQSHKEICKLNAEGLSRKPTCNDMMEAFTRIVPEGVLPFLVYETTNVLHACGIGLSGYPNSEYKFAWMSPEYGRTSGLIILLYESERNTRHGLLSLVPLVPNAERIQDIRTQTPALVVSLQPSCALICSSCQCERAIYVLHGCKCRHSCRAVVEGNASKIIRIGKCVCGRCAASMKLKRLQKCHCGKQIVGIAILKTD